MCVILTAETNRVPKRMLVDAVRTNPHGNGIAWIDGSAVRYEKGISLKALIELASEIPLPYVVHARIATAGGITPELCHPFPIGDGLDAEALWGHSRRGVLFHNGHWHGWKDYLALEDLDEKTAERDGWSDSRLMAALVTTYGARIVDKVIPASQRVVLMTKRGPRRYGMGWSEVSDGVYASNRVFLPIDREDFALSRRVS